MKLWIFRGQSCKTKQGISIQQVKEWTLNHLAMLTTCTDISKGTDSHMSTVFPCTLCVFGEFADFLGLITQGYDAALQNPSGDSHGCEQEVPAHIVCIPYTKSLKLSFCIYLYNI